MIRLPFAPILIVSVWAGTVLTTGCDHQADSTTNSGVGLAMSSESVRNAVVLQDSLLASGPPLAPMARDVHRYFHYSNVLFDPERREAARDTFYNEWSENPEHVLFIELAVAHRRRLGSHPRHDEWLAAAAGTDTTRAIYHFVKARRDWGKRRGAGPAFDRAHQLATAGDSLLATWAQMRAAQLAATGGQTDGAYSRLISALRPAWETGGPILASAIWQELSVTARLSGRLDDAQLAATEAEACAIAAGSGYQRTRARISLGHALLQRGRYDAAAATATASYAAARDSGYVRLRASAARLGALVAHARGDLKKEIDEVRHLLDLSLASADTSGATRSALALAGGLRRSGDLEGARHWFDWAEAINSAWSKGNLIRTIREARAILFNQEGHYAAAESLWVLSAQDADLANNREQALLIQVKLIDQALETGRPKLAYRALARARELSPETIAPTRDFDTALYLALAAARLHARQGEFHLADQQLKVAESRANPTNLQSAWFHTYTKGRVAREAGDYVTAHRAFSRSISLADTLGEPNKLQRSRVRLSAVMLAEGQFAEAIELVAAGRDASEYWTRVNALLITAMALAGSGDHEKALATLDAAEVALGAAPPTDLKARLDLERGRSLASLQRYDQAYALFRSARKTLADPAWSEATEVGQAFNRVIRREIAEALLGLLHDHPQSAGRSAVVELSREVAAWARNTVPAGAVGPRLEFFLGAKRAFAWATSGGGLDFVWEEIAPTPELVAMVDAVTTDMSYPGREVGTKTLQRLSDTLFGPLRNRWPSDTNLEISPDGVLKSLPWSALPWPADGRPVLAHGPVTITVGAPRISTSGDLNALLALGANGAGHDGSPRLVHAEGEARAIAAAWNNGPVVLRVGPQAALANVLSGGMQGYRAIHISSHAQVYEGADGSSTIRVWGDSDRPLTLEDIVAADTDAELVYLSNCDGARQHRNAGRGVLSFADAFLVAGADGVVATSVAVDDAASRVLAESFYQHWLTGKERAAALQAARLDLLKADSRWRHPFYWAFTNFYARPSP